MTINSFYFYYFLNLSKKIRDLNFFNDFKDNLNNILKPVSPKILLSKF